MIKVQLEFKSYRDVEDAFKRLGDVGPNGALRKKMRNSSVKPPELSSPGHSSEKVVLQDTTKKRGPKAATQPQAPAKAASGKGTSEVLAANDHYSKDDVLKALETLNEAKGLPVAKQALGKFNAKKMSDIPVDQYKAFITHATELANS